MILTYPALRSDIPTLDQIARACEKLAPSSLGWVRRDSMERAYEAGCLNIAQFDAQTVGFVLWSNPTRGTNKGFRVVHTLAVHPDYQRKGIGRSLLEDLLLPVRLKCPITVGRDNRTNPANAFYAALGLTLLRIEVTKAGRQLNVWERA